MDADEPETRYIGISQYLEEHPDRRDHLNQLAYRLTLETLLRDGRCEFCGEQPISWGHNYDHDVIQPRYNDLYWLTCAACESRYSDGEDAAVLARMSEIPSDADVALLATFRRADVTAYPIPQESSPR